MLEASARFRPRGDAGTDLRLNGLYHMFDATATLQLENGANAPLGTTANISSTGEKTVAKFALLSHAQMLLGSADVRNRGGKRPHRTRVCHAYKSENSERIVLRLNGDASKSAAGFSGLQTCGSIWACPVCASREASEKAEFILKSMSWAKRANKKAFMMTLTARHNRYMTLEDLETRFKAAWNTLTGHRDWRKFKKELGIEAWIANVENTYGENGWHYHKHIQLYADFDMIKQEKEQADFTSLWIRCLAIHGLEALPEYAVKFTTGSAVGDTYLTKCGITVTETNGRVEYEMTGSEHKDSKNIWQLLEMSKYGNAHAGKLYLEYVQHMTGKNFLTTSHGLGDLIADEEAAAADDEASENEMAAMSDWAEISPYWWSEVIRPARGMSDVLKVAARTRNVNKVRELLWELQEKLIAAGVLGEYHRQYRFKAMTGDFVEGIRRL